MAEPRLSPPSRTSPGLLPGALAVLGPALVLAAASAMLAGSEPEDAARHVRGDFACEHADIVITGSSRARTDIDPRQLAEALAPPRREAMAATVHGSNAPVWYAVLKNGIFARGCEPELIIVYDIADKLFAADVLPDERVRLLAPYLTGDDPVLEQRIYKKPRRGWWTRTRERVSGLRETWMATLTAWATGLMFAPHPEETRVQQGRRILTAVFDGVFAGEKLRKVAGPAQVPVIPAGAPRPEQQNVLARRPEDTFLPDIIELAGKHGARVLFVRAPSPPSRRGAEHVPPALARGCAALVERLGGYYLDLRTREVRDAWYADVRHMNALGRRHVTRAIAARIRDLGLLAPSAAVESAAQTRPGGATGNAQVDLLDAEVRVAGTPPPLPTSADIQSAGNNVAAFPVPGYRDAAGDACEAHHLIACCSPRRITEDRVPLPFPNSPLDEVTRLGRGRYAHVGDKVLFTAIDGSDPVRNGHAYQVSLESDRFCGSYWLLPGESLSFSRTPPGDSAESLSVTRLEFWARRFSSAEARIRVRLSCDGRTHLETILSEQSMRAEPATVPMDPLEVTDCRHLSLEVAGTPPEATWVITWARLLN